MKTHSHEALRKYTGIFAILVDGVDTGGINTDKPIEFLEKYCK